MFLKERNDEFRKLRNWRANVEDDQIGRNRLQTLSHIGQRPIDIHVRGLRGLGANVTIGDGYINADTDRLKGATISLEGPSGSSVGATCNVMMMAALAKGTSVLTNAAAEPEVSDLADFLTAMGANISGIGTSTLTVEGVDTLKGVDYEVTADRIEAGTFMTAIAATRSEGVIQGCRCEHMESVINKLQEIGIKVDKMANGVRIDATENLKPVNIRTMPYPGFPTDMQAQLTALLCTVPGESIITETIFPERFMHCAELRRMGADILVSNGKAIIHSNGKLAGAPVMASDLRASAALVIAGLAAEGKTEILRVYHIDRGYERIEEKLQQLGAEIYRYDPAQNHKHKR